jgi:hypothetical protein
MPRYTIRPAKGGGEGDHQGGVVPDSFVTGVYHTIEEDLKTTGFSEFGEH